MGVVPHDCDRAIKAGCKSVDDALEFIFSRTPALPAAGPLVPDTASSPVSNQPHRRAEEVGDAAGALLGLVGAGSEDAELQMALEESRKEAERSNNDEEVQRAIAESLRDQRVHSNLWNQAIHMKPSQRARASLNEPVGLRNVGNTCYLNSLLQVYFHLPDFRRKILSFDGAALSSSSALNSEQGDEAHGSAKAALNFVSELQRLFGYMALSSEKFVDPSAVIEALRGPDGKPIEIGGQQDVSEFNQLLLDTVRLAEVALSDRSWIVGNPDFILVFSKTLVA